MLDKEPLMSYIPFMPRGKQTRVLEAEQIARLEKFRTAPHKGAPHGYSFARLRKAMAASFTAETLIKALRGLPVWDLHHGFIVQWIERYLPVATDGQTTSEEAAATAIQALARAKGMEALEPAASEEVPSRITDPQDDHSGDPLRGRRMDSADVNDDEEEAGTTGTVRGSR